MSRTTKGLSRAYSAIPSDRPGRLAWAVPGREDGISAALGPLIGGVLIQFIGMSDGWRWVFLVNLFIGVVEHPVAFKVLPRRHEPEEHHLDITGSMLLTGVLPLVLIP